VVNCRNFRLLCRLHETMRGHDSCTYALAHMSVHRYTAQDLATKTTLRAHPTCAFVFFCASITACTYVHVCVCAFLCTHTHRHTQAHVYAHALICTRTRTTAGAATFLVKVKVHRGEPANEEADIQADKAISGEDVATKWHNRTNRGVFTWQEPRWKGGAVSKAET